MMVLPNFIDSTPARAFRQKKCRSQRNAYLLKTPARRSLNQSSKLSFDLNLFTSGLDHKCK